MKILFIGNSFAEDTAEHAASVALSMKLSNIKIGVLYVGGCSIEMHYDHIVRDAATYIYHLNEGDGGSSTPDFRISDALASDEWDWIVIQHGTREASRYTSLECYECLGPLIAEVKRAQPRAKISFNLTWMGEPDYNHHEIVSYGGNVKLMREKLIEVTKAVLSANPEIDLLIPTGTAVENARTSKSGLWTRDGYHLSLDRGRYVAALTLICALAGTDPEESSWQPDGVDEYSKLVAIEAVRAALSSPFEITSVREALGG
jgi:hypothetical protein